MKTKIDDQGREWTIALAALPISGITKGTKFRFLTEDENTAAQALATSAYNSLAGLALPDSAIDAAYEASQGPYFKPSHRQMKFNAFFAIRRLSAARRIAVKHFGTADTEVIAKLDTYIAEIKSIIGTAPRF